MQLLDSRQPVQPPEPNPAAPAPPIPTRRKVGKVGKRRKHFRPTNLLLCKDLAEKGRKVGVLLSSSSPTGPCSRQMNPLRTSDLSYYNIYNYIYYIDLRHRERSEERSETLPTFPTFLPRGYPTQKYRAPLPSFWTTSSPRSCKVWT